MDTNQKTVCFQRINSDNVKEFIGQNLTVVGKVKSYKDGILNLSFDTGEIEILNIDQLEDDKIIIEIRGTLTENCQLEAQEFTQMSNNFDLEMYYKVVKLMQSQFKELFYESKKRE